MVFWSLGVDEITQEDWGWREENGTTDGTMRATVFKEQEEEESTKIMESEQTETEEGGVIEVQGGRGFNWAKCW